jgi:hypothetical protein
LYWENESLLFRFDTHPENTIRKWLYISITKSEIYTRRKRRYNSVGTDTKKGSLILNLRMGLWFRWCCFRLFHQRLEHFQSEITKCLYIRKRKHVLFNFFILCVSVFLLLFIQQDIQPTPTNRPALMWSSHKHVIPTSKTSETNTHTHNIYINSIIYTIPQRHWMRKGTDRWCWPELPNASVIVKGKEKYSS